MVVVVVSTVAAVVDDDVVAVASPVVVFAAVEDVAVAASAGLSDAAAAALFLSPKTLGRRLIIICQKNLNRFCSKLHSVVIVNHYFIACSFIGLYRVSKIKFSEINLL